MGEVQLEDAARERRLRKSLLQKLRRNGYEPPLPTRNTRWATPGVIPVGSPRARPVQASMVSPAYPGTSTIKHSVDTRSAEEMVTIEAWDDAGADDPVSDHTHHASASSTSMPGVPTVMASAPCSAPGDQTVASPTSGVTAITTAPLVAATVTTPATGTGATDIMGDFVGWLRDDDVGPMVLEELGTGGGMLGGRGGARLACTCRAAEHALRERNKKAMRVCLPHGLDYWLASCLEQQHQVRLLEGRTAADTRDLNPRGTVLHGCIHASALPCEPYHVDEFDSVIVVGCPANATDDFRIG